MKNGRPLERAGNRSVSGAYAGLIRSLDAGLTCYVYLMLAPDHAEPFEALGEIIRWPELRWTGRITSGLRGSRGPSGLP